MAETGKELSLKIIFDTLLEMRTQRWGLIQTEQQLKFSVDAIIHGLKNIDLVSGHNTGTAASKQSNHTNGKRLKEDRECDDSTDNENDDEGQSKSKKRKNSES